MLYLHHPPGRPRPATVGALGAVFCACWLLTCCLLPGQLLANSELVFERLVNGLERRSFAWQPIADGGAIQVHAFRVDPRVHRFRVVRAAPVSGSESYPTVHALARREGLPLAVNASFFDERGRPLGLLVDQGRVQQPVRAVDWGVFFVRRDGVAGIVHARDFVLDAEIDAAVQAGPRLVVDGRPTRLKPQIARRTAICVTQAGAVIVLVTEAGALLADLARLLARPTGSGGLGCYNALNLDGGSSTQATLLLAGARWDLYGGTGVPVALGIQPRAVTSPGGGGQP